MDQFEDFVRRELKEAETQPPEQLWEQLEPRIPKPRHRFRWLVAAAGILAAASLCVAVIYGIKGLDSISTEQLSATATADEPAITAENNLAPQQTTQTTATRGNKPEREAEAINNSNAKTSVVTAKADSDRQTTATTATTATKAPQPTAAATTVQPAVAANPSADENDVDLTALEEEFFKKYPKSVDSKQPSNTATAADTSPISLSDNSSNSIIPAITIPNLLTPNGDGRNDCWVIRDIEQFRRTEVQLYNDKGRRVFTSANYRGEFCGNGLPDGNYFYLLHIPEINHTRRGVLVISR